MSDIRQIQIAGAKPSDFKRRRTRKRLEGGGEEEGDPLPILSAPKGPIKVSKINEVATPIKEEVVAPAITKPSGVEAAPAPAPPSTPLPTEQAGGAKVILKPKVAKPTKVLLRKKEPVSGSQPAPEPKPLKVKTRKVVLQALSKRINKTRHAMKHAKELPIEQVRAVLIDKKLIKSTSKAPDAVLRQIYSDSLIVAKKTL